MNPKSDWYSTLARVTCEKNNYQWDFNMRVITPYPLTNKKVRAEMAAKILREHKVEGAKNVEFDKSIIWLL